MSRFIIPVKDAQGNKVYFQTSPHKGQVTVDGYASVIMWLEKNGFKLSAMDVQEAPKPTPQATTSSEKHCSICGQLMTYKEGVSKTGKPWKGFFCPERGHEPIWIK